MMIEKKMEREREKWMILVTTASQIAEESKVVFIAKLFFLGIMKLRIIFV